MKLIVALLQLVVQLIWAVLGNQKARVYNVSLELLAHLPCPKLLKALLPEDTKYICA
jgi:hypothetical protein